MLWLLNFDKPVICTCGTEIYWWENGPTKTGSTFIPRDLAFRWGTVIDSTPWCLTSPGHDIPTLDLGLLLLRGLLYLRNIISLWLPFLGVRSLVFLISWPPSPLLTKGTSPEQAYAYQHKDFVCIPIACFIAEVIAWGDPLFSFNRI